MKEYLIHQSWSNDFQIVVDAYRDQLSSIKEDLLQRSALLDKATVDNPDRSAWYEEYRRQSADLLQRLIDSGVLVPRESVDRIALETDRGLRASFGLFTKGSEFPESSEHPALLNVRHPVKLS